MVSLSVLTINAETRRRRIRLATSLAMYGGALGAATILISLLHRTPFGLEPQHMRLVPSVFVSLGGGIAGVLIALPMGYFTGAGSGSRLQDLLVWWGIGFAFGVLLPFLTGALVPLSMIFVDLSLDIIQPDELFVLILDAVFRAPLNVFINGALSLYTGLLAGALFGTGGWVLDMLNGSSKPVAANFGPWAIAFILGFVAVGIAVFGSPDTLAKLG